LPQFLEDKLKAEYGDNDAAVYGTLNNIGAMHGNKETAKGKAMEAKHEADIAQKPPKKKSAIASDTAGKALAKRMADQSHVEGGPE
jgi:hypothetical protein